MRDKVYNEHHNVPHAATPGELKSINGGGMWSEQVGVAPSRCNEGEAGNGLFARRAIKASRKICVMNAIPCPSSRRFESAYVIRTQHHGYMDMQSPQAGYSGYANDALDAMLDNCTVKYDKVTRQYYLYATKNIATLDEILLPYDGEYWWTNIEQRHPRIRRQIEARYHGGEMVGGNCGSINEDYAGEDMDDEQEVIDLTGDATDAEMGSEQDDHVGDL